jgi:hypothetical protein
MRAALVANGLRWAAQFSWDRAANDTEEMIEEAIAPRQGSVAATAARLNP